MKTVNSLGTIYGDDATFITLGQEPTATTMATTNVNSTSATLNGSVNANYLSTVVTFEYGTTASYGSTATATQSPIIGNTITNASVSITGLSAGTTYHFRVKAVNSLGSTYGSDIIFTTLGQVPTVTTMAATNITTTAAQLSGSVNANYLSTVVTFEYGTTQSYGSTAIATQSPITGNMIANVSANVTGLTKGITYHYRVKAVNSLGTTYGSDMTFLANYVIGAIANGGIIFYIDATGEHGLVATTMVLGPSTFPTAVDACSSLVLNTYSGWSLPSIVNLNLIYLNLQVTGLDVILVPNTYWSGTRIGIVAWVERFTDGYQYNNYTDDGTVTYNYRAIRQF